MGRPCARRPRDEAIRAGLCVGQAGHVEGGRAETDFVFRKPGRQRGGSDVVDYEEECFEVFGRCGGEGRVGSVDARYY